MIYLAQPYSHPNGLVVSGRVKVAEYFFAKWSKEGEIVFSPIIHCHKVANMYGLPTDAAFWEKWNDEFLNASEEVRVLKMPGWELSKGLTYELAYAKLHGKKITFIEWPEIYRDCSDYQDKFNEFPFPYWLNILANKSA